MKLDNLWSIEVKVVLQYWKMTNFVKARRINLIEKYYNNNMSKKVEKKI